MSVQDHEHNACRTRVILNRIGVDYISSAVQTFVERDCIIVSSDIGETVRQTTNDKYKDFLET